MHVIVIGLDQAICNCGWTLEAHIEELKDKATNHMLTNRPAVIKSLIKE